MLSVQYHPVITDNEVAVGRSSIVLIVEIASLLLDAYVSVSFKMASTSCSIDDKLLSVPPLSRLLLFTPNSTKNVNVSGSFSVVEKHCMAHWELVTHEALGGHMEGAL